MERRKAQRARIWPRNGARVSGIPRYTRGRPARRRVAMSRTDRRLRREALGGFLAVKGEGPHRRKVVEGEEDRFVGGGAIAVRVRAPRRDREDVLLFPFEGLVA